MLIGLICGCDFNLFRPRTVSYGHEEYEAEVLKRQFQYFGPCPAKYEEIASPEAVHSILYLMQEIPKAETTFFQRTTERERGKMDKDYIGRIMKLGWRDRPTAEELLNDKWFEEEHPARLYKGKSLFEEFREYITNGRCRHEARNIANSLAGRKTYPMTPACHIKDLLISSQSKLPLQSSQQNHHTLVTP